MLTSHIPSYSRLIKFEQIGRPVLPSNRLVQFCQLTVKLDCSLVLVSIAIVHWTSFVVLLLVPITFVFLTIKLCNSGGVQIRARFCFVCNLRPPRELDRRHKRSPMTTSRDWPAFRFGTRTRSHAKTMQATHVHLATSQKQF